MLTLRTGGQFADRQIRKHLKNALLCFALTIVAIFAIRYIQIPLVGLGVTIFALLLFKENINLWGNWFVGKHGDRQLGRTTFGIGRRGAGRCLFDLR